MAQESHIPACLLQLKQARKEMLRLIALTANDLGTHGATKENIRIFLGFIHREGLITIEELANMALTDRCTASRWLNGRSSPKPLARQVILQKITEKAAKMADEMKIDDI